MTSKFNKKIFAVDDDYSIRFTLEGILADSGCIIKTFDSVDSCIKTLTVDTPDMFILDLEMPEKNGFDMIRYLNSDDKLASIPKLVLSSLNDLKTIKKIKELGISHYAIKPIDYHVLMKKVAQILDAEIWKEITLKEEIEIFCLGGFLSLSESNIEVITSFRPSPNSVFQVESNYFDSGDESVTVISSDRPAKFIEKGKYQSVFSIQGISTDLIDKLKKSKAKL